MCRFIARLGNTFWRKSAEHELKRKIEDPVTNKCQRLIAVFDRSSSCYQLGEAGWAQHPETGNQTGAGRTVADVQWTRSGLRRLWRRDRNICDTTRLKLLI